MIYETDSEINLKLSEQAQSPRLSYGFVYFEHCISLPIPLFIQRTMPFLISSLLYNIFTDLRSFLKKEPKITDFFMHIANEKIRGLIKCSMITKLVIIYFGYLQMII